jgi:hypothetical protein
MGGRMRGGSRYQVVACALSIAAVAACGLMDFDLLEQIPPHTVYGNPVTTSGATFTLGLDFSQDPIGSAGPFSSVHLKSMTLSLDPSSGESSFDFLEEVRVHIASSRENTLLKEVEIAQVTVPRGVQTLRLTAHTDVDLLPYIQEGRVVHFLATARLPKRDAVFIGVAVFRVGVLGS